MIKGVKFNCLLLDKLLIKPEGVSTKQTGRFAPRCLLSQVLCLRSTVLLQARALRAACRGRSKKGEVVLAELLSSKHQEFEKNPLRVFFGFRKLCCRPLVGSLAAGRELYRSEFPLHHPKKPFSSIRWESFLLPFIKKGTVSPLSRFYGTMIR